MSNLNVSINNENLNGTLSENIIVGMTGDDVFLGGDSEDSLYGDVYEVDVEGNLITSGDGADQLFGGNGDDFVFGGNGSDVLYGDVNVDLGNGNDDLIGGQGNDELYGGKDNDTLVGCDNEFITSELAAGVGEIDSLLGGAGQDVFALGDSYEAYYLGTGAEDYAKIEDFNRAEGDSITLFGSAENYSLGANAEGGTEILFQGDLVGVVSNATDLSLESDFTFAAQI